MFRRLVLRTTPKPFITTTTYNARRCLSPLFSYPDATVSRDHVRHKHLYRKRASATTSGGSGRGNRLHAAWDFEISPTAYSSLKALGMNHDETFNLLGAIRVRTSEARGLRFIFDCLNNRGRSRYIFHLFLSSILYIRIPHLPGHSILHRRRSCLPASALRSLVCHTSQ